ncbi:MAG: DEAD/DEAH box helicase family protein [Candidatus Aenigmarchaeota archaeon]|nr:DEAD/DEAH box helicase family protein [Candidatus Aenigmarchaeota archaeon]
MAVFKAFLMVPAKIRLLHEVRRPVKIPKFEGLGTHRRKLAFAGMGAEVPDIKTLFFYRMNTMVDLSEKQTREQYIDSRLEELGWKEQYVKKEVNSKATNFKTKKYVFLKTGYKDGRFIDFVLTDEHQSPIAIIEAKKFSLDPDKGIIQATTYQKDIESQIGHAVPIFLTNGKKWYIKEKDYPMREISGPFSQEDLQKKFSLSKNRADLSNIEVNTEIVDRSKSIEIIKQILNNFSSGNRSALISMATGTGKTRVAMGIIHALLKARYVQNVLFVVDRISLGRLAFYNGFQKYFSSTPSCLMNEQAFSKDKRFYVSTVQTLMAKQRNGERLFQSFSPGFFDLIIYDEAHRSYYDKQNLVMKYFDVLKIGLTATPSKSEGRDTYDLFGCERGKPTVEYTYDEAVKDGVLVPYDAQIIETKVLKLGISGMDLDKELRTELIKQDEDPEVFKVPGKRFARYFTDKRTNELIVSEFMNRCHKTEDEKPCKTIFFCVNVEHAKALKKRFDEMYPNLCNETEVIVSEFDRYMDAVERFMKDESPKVAISVGVLDTGVDIPEVCNLVFVTPVLSRIRFWQMVGRGTRSISACRHMSRLPVYDGVPDKRDFRILDFKFGDFSNVLEHRLEVSDDTKSREDIREKILRKQIELLKKDLSPKEKDIVENHIVERIDNIDKKSFIVRDKIPIIKKIVSKPYDIKSHVDEIKKEIVPLLKFSDFGDGKVQTFISNCVDLFRYVKEDDKEGIDNVRDFIEERVISIWESDIEAVKKKSGEIKQILQEKFWQDLTFDDVDFLIRNIAPLMVYYEKERKKIVRVHAPDFVIKVEDFKMQFKEDKRFEEFKKSELVRKMVRDGVTWQELRVISQELAKLNSAWTIENVQKNQDFILFLRNILDLKDLPDPEYTIKQEFETLIMEKNKDYNVEQIRFLRMLASFFAINKHLERKDFTSYPLADERPLEKFSREQLQKIIEAAEKIKIR